MYGYVVIDKPNMYVKDFAAYRGYYCGLCKAIGRQCGQTARFFTNYDATFLNAFFHGVLGVEPSVKRQCCLLNPVIKKPVVQTDGITRLVLNANFILSYYKIKDNIKDDKGLKRFVGYCTVKRCYKKAKKTEPELERVIRAGIEMQAEVEKNAETSVDMAAHPFGCILRDIARVALGDRFDGGVSRFMYNLGRYVYIIDAVDDFDKDKKRGGFNPLKAREDGEIPLNACLNAMKDSFAQIKLGTADGIITNIVWYGLPQKAMQVIDRKTAAKDEICQKHRI